MATPFNRQSLLTPFCSPSRDIAGKIYSLLPADLLRCIRGPTPDAHYIRRYQLKKNKTDRPFDWTPLVVKSISLSLSPSLSLFLSLTRSRKDLMVTSRQRSRPAMDATDKMPVWMRFPWNSSPPPRCWGQAICIHAAWLYRRGILLGHKIYSLIRWPGV